MLCRMMLGIIMTVGVSQVGRRASSRPFLLSLTRWGSSTSESGAWQTCHALESSRIMLGTTKRWNQTARGCVSHFLLGVHMVCTLVGCVCVLYTRYMYDLLVVCNAGQMMNSASGDTARQRTPPNLRSLSSFDSAMDHCSANVAVCCVLCDFH